MLTLFFGQVMTSFKHHQKSCRWFHSDVLFALVVLWVFGTIPSPLVFGQAQDPLDSTKVLNLSTFATHPNSPTGSGAIDLEHPKDGSGRIFVSTNDGKVHGYASNGDSLGVFLDLSAQGVASDFDPTLGFTTRGLSYIAFHPDYAKSGAAGEGAFYTMYKSIENNVPTPDYSMATLATRPGNVLSQYVIGEWRVDPLNANRIDTTSRREVIRFEFSGSAEDTHSVGEIAFNPFSLPDDADYGNLYVGLGDGFGSGTVPNWQHVQDSTNPFGKILRINPLSNGGGKYSVPDDNPFSDGGPLLDNDQNAEEIAAIGFRYPQNFSFARDASGQPRIVAFDIGADDFEELNLVDVGDNHGWTRYDGPVDGNLNTTLHPSPNLVLEFPAAVYDHVFPNVPGASPTGGNAVITGGFSVSNPADSGFQNQVLFGDLARGAFFHASMNALVTADASDTQATVFVMDVSIDGASPGSFRDQIGASRGDARFGVDESGRLFVVSRRTNAIFLTDLIADQLPISGDFDGDEDIDGNDFLRWQRGESPHPVSPIDLAAWEASFGKTLPLSAVSTTVPEPTTGSGMILALLALLMSQRKLVWKKVRVVHQAQ